MLVPAALRRWAAEHTKQLSGDTLSEVEAIAAALEGTEIGTVEIARVGAHPPLGVPAVVLEQRDIRIDELFDADRAERARTLIDIVAEWGFNRGLFDSEPSPEPTPAPPPPAAEVVAPEPVSEPVDPSLGTAPAFLRSDKVDEEDDSRLYGPKRGWWRWVFGLVGLGALIAVGVAAWWFVGRSDDAAEQVQTEPAPTQTQTQTQEEVPAPPSASPSTSVEPDTDPAPTVAATATAEPQKASRTIYWADTTKILNSGSAEIGASTYSVSPSNRAVLTGHTAAVTGIAIADDGRVLTSGADSRLVDWGADVTLAVPDVVSVPAPLTALIRTVDPNTDTQNLVAGDAQGNVIVIDIVDGGEPLVVTVHPSAISAVAGLADGRLAVASVDGDLAVFSPATPDDRVSLPHSSEITSVIALDDGELATSAVDGAIRFWSPTTAESTASIQLGAPLTALGQLSDGAFAAATVDGTVTVIDPTLSAAIFELTGHNGPVRAVREVEGPLGERLLATGGDDATIRLWTLDTGTQVRILEGHGDLVSAIDVLPDGRMVTTSADGTGRVWDLTVAPATPVEPPHAANMSAIAGWSNDQFITGAVDGSVVRVSTSDSVSPEPVTRHSAPIVGLATMPNGDIVSLDATSEMRVVSGQDTFEIQIAAGATALDAQGDAGVVTGHADGSVRFNDFTDEVYAVEVHASGVNDVAALSTGQVASAGQDMTVRIVDFENPEIVPVFDLHTAPVDVVVELPDGRIASAGSDAIYVWSLDGLAQDHIRLNGHRTTTLSLVPLAGNRLLSTGTDGRVRLWDLDAPEAESETVLDIPGIVNPHMTQAGNGLLVAGAARGYVVFSLT